MIQMKQGRTFISIFLAVFLFLTIVPVGVSADLISGQTDDLKGSIDYAYFLVLDSFGACNINPDTGEVYDSKEYTQITKDTAADRCAGYGLRGGNFIFYIILPILLAYFILFAIMQKTNLFDSKTSKNISIVLALVMIPLGVFRMVFITLISFLTGGTVTLLYIFLFVFILGWGYKNMYAKGRVEINESSIGLQESKHAAEHVKRIGSSIHELNAKLINLSNREAEIAHKKATVTVDNPRQMNESDIDYMQRITKKKSNLDDEKKEIEGSIEDLKTSLTKLMALKNAKVAKEKIK
ncbi:MAG: hypothetical protein U9P44_03575 [archaeon]|nr:hypothetical protein [archaeon]